MRFFVPAVFLLTAYGLHRSNRPGAVWVLPYTETLARKWRFPTQVGATTEAEQLLAADLTVGFLAAIGCLLLILSLWQTIRAR